MKREIKTQFFAHERKPDNSALWMQVRVNVLSRSVVSGSLRPPWTVAHQASPSMGISRQKYWSGLPFPSPGDLPDPGIEPVSPVSPAWAGGFFTSEPPGKPRETMTGDTAPPLKCDCSDAVLRDRAISSFGLCIKMN